MFATKEQVQCLRERSIEWEKEDFETADPLIPQVVRLLNKVETIACVWSCEGHYNVSKLHVKEDSIENFYLMLAVTEEGFQFVQKLFTNLQERLVAIALEKKLYQNNGRLNHDAAWFIVNPIRTSLSFTTRFWPGEDSVLYNVVILNTITHSKKGGAKEDMKLSFFKELVKVIADLV